MSRGLGKVQAQVLNRVARWQYFGEESSWLGWVIPESDKSVYRAIKLLEERGLVYRVCSNGEEPIKQRVKRGKRYYTRYVCDGETMVKVTPKGLQYWSDNILKGGADD